MGHEIMILILWLPLVVLLDILLLCESWAVANRLLKRAHCHKYHLFPGDHYWDENVSIFTIWAESRRMRQAVALGQGKILRFNDSRKFTEHDLENNPNFLD